MQLSLTYFFYHSCATNLGSVCSTFPFPESGFLVICLLVYCPPPSPWTDLHESKDILWCVSSAPTILPVTPRLSTLFVEWWKPLQNFQAVSNKKWKGVTLQQMWPRYWSDHFCTQTKRFLFQRVKLVTGIHHARKTDLSYPLEILPYFPNSQGVTHELVYLDWRVGQQEGINFWGSDLRKWNLIRSQIIAVPRFKMISILQQALLHNQEFYPAGTIHWHIIPKELFIEHGECNWSSTKHKERLISDGCSF